MPRRQLLDVAEHAEGRRDQAQREVLIERREIHLAQRRIEREQGLDLRGEREPSGLLDVEQRLLPEMVPRREQPLLARVPESKCEHAAQVIQATVAIGFVEPDDHFAVALRDEAMPASFELPAQLLVIVDLAVAHEPDRALGVGERLAAPQQVDDGQSPMTERGGTVPVDALAVGAAVHERGQHPGDIGTLRLQPSHDARNTTHQCPPPRRIANLRTASSNTVSYRAAHLSMR